MTLPPRTYNKDHIFKNTTTFGEDDDRNWEDRKYAVLKHAYNNVKFAQSFGI